MKLSSDGKIRRSVYVAFAATVTSVTVPVLAHAETTPVMVAQAETGAVPVAPTEAAPAPVAESVPVASAEAAPAVPEPAAAGAVTLGSVRVTGSRIKSQTFTASSPVAEISGAEFARSGATLVEELVNQYPQLAPQFDNTENNPSLGYATVDLRGLGPQRTLALVNGRRLPKGFGELSDISIIPASVIKRVDVLTGGASAVYGSDAVAGVVNFILNDNFRGVSLTGGWSAYQHDNNNSTIRSRLDARDFDYPEGNSGFDGIARNLDFAIGGRFGEAGSATAWATWRENAPLFQGERDYSSCALNASGSACGGSATADPANFYIVDSSAGFYNYVQRAGSMGSWSVQDTPNLFNFAPINYYQRPDTRFTAGTSLSYEISEFAKPYMQAMFVNRTSVQQIAPSGAFFTDLQNVPCDTPEIGTMCADLGLAADDMIDTIYVAKRNVEGGPRINTSEVNNYSITTGVGGKLIGRWDYDAAITYNRASTSITGINDFLTSRIRDALLGCQDGSFDGCIPYEVFSDTVTAEQAQALQGISQQQIVTATQGLNAYVTGDLGVGLPSAGGELVSLVAGVETRRDTYSYSADSNLADGNFAGSGSQSPPLKAAISVREFYLESGVPILSKLGIMDKLDMELGYRLSDYDRAGTTATYKIGFGATMLDEQYRIRGGFNRAIRAPSINELFLPQQLGLWSGADPCAGPMPEFTQEQCANTGVTAAQFGSVPRNSASQYNQIGGGNTELTPEKADTFTIGLAATPIKNLQLSLDYFNIEIEDSISPVGARNIIDICALTGDATSCALIRRNATTGDLFRGSDPDTAGLVRNVITNLGGETLSGLDLTASYNFRLGPGKLHTSILSTYLLESEVAPLSATNTVTAECSGNISPQCQVAQYRHVASARYEIDRYTAGIRWRYMSGLDYEDPRDFRRGRPLTTDQLVVAEGGVDAYNWFDVHGSVSYGPAVMTFGINNVLDEEPPLVGSTLTLNGNSIGGYDQLGRYLFTSLKLSF